MSFIHDIILDYTQQVLQAALINNIDEGDTARAGLVQQGPLQGPGSPDKLRIVATVHENDPDRFVNSNTSAMTGAWEDEILIHETGSVDTWARRFSVKIRCLLAKTKEDLDATRQIASTVRSRAEQAIREADFNNLAADDGEYVSRRAANIKGEMVQAGGPGSYDYHIKLRFDVLTTTQGVS